MASRQLLTLNFVRSLSGTPLSSFQYGLAHPPVARNEPPKTYERGHPDTLEVQRAVDELKKRCGENAVEIPCIVGGEEIRTGKIGVQRQPAAHQQIVAKYHECDRKVATLAIEKALQAKQKWEQMPFDARCAIFLKAADLVSGKYRAEALAAAMLGQGKNIWQAEIDAATEQADFWRFNVHFAQEIYRQQPALNGTRTWNRLEYRPLEGFVLAISPFNFAAIGANLVSAPALMGNVVLWKPSSTSILSNYITMKILHEAGLPDGVINLLPGYGSEVSGAAFAHSEFSGLHFTGSTKTFDNLTNAIHENRQIHRSFPRIVGETGGKNFHFVHASADADQVVMQTIRAAFEYNGQKCSACSRAYIPDNLWPAVKAGMIDTTNEIIEKHMGQPDERSTLVTAVIDKAAFDRLKTTIDRLKSENSEDVKIIAGGKYDDSNGYFIQPTVVEIRNPNHWLMKEEQFGPIVAMYVYPEAEFERYLEVCDATAAYGLTGAIFARDRYAIELASYKLRNTAGNFYINDKCTGAVVGQQAFGGARASGTNDKAGSSLNLMRWVSTRTIKEFFHPLVNWKYPSMM